jgi:hypothetical protein
MPRDQGLANVNDYRDLDVIAAIMPNEPGIRNVDWTSYITTVDAVEALSGYDILALLPDPVEVAVESELKAAILLVERLLPSGGTLAGDGKWLINKLELAAEHLAHNLRLPATNQLEDVLRRLDALVRAGTLSTSAAASLSAIVTRVMQSTSS